MNAQVQPVKQGAAIGGWVCLGLGLLLITTSPLLMLLYVPLFIAAFVLGIVAMAQKRVGQGVTILLLSIIGPIAGVGLFAKNISDAMNEAKKPLAERAKPASGGASAFPSVASVAAKNDAEKAAYVASNLELYDVKADMYTTFNEKVPGVEFKLKNKGSRSLDEVEVTVYFMDESGATIAEEDYRPVFVSEYNFGDSNKPLKPGYIWQQERGRFYKAESVPNEWKVGSIRAEVTDIRFTP